MTKYAAKLPDSNNIIAFTEEENETWHILIKRQYTTIIGRACDEFLDGLEKLKLPLDRIPQCFEISQTLNTLTGWSIVPVAAIIPLSEFFSLLSQRKFPAASFIRIREELDYLQEPDIFHEIFGHCPFFAHKPYANFIEQFAKAAVLCDEKTQSILGRLFWYTIEFGLIDSDQGTRIFGAGILSSHNETIYALENKTPERISFDTKTALTTEYRYDIIQPLYLILKDSNQLYNLNITEIINLAKKIAAHPFHEKDFVIC